MPVLIYVCPVGDVLPRLHPRLWMAEPPALQPLHMSAVREALGALIPAALHRNLDKAAQRAKDELGALRGGSVLCVDGWRVSVRSEDALARGRLQEDVLEFSC